MVLIPHTSRFDLDDFFGENFSNQRVGRRSGSLAVDVYEQGDDVVADINLPGVDPDDVEVKIDKNMLTISGTHEEKKEKQNKNYTYRERRFGSFRRSVRLPKLVDDESTEAAYKDGVLKVTMPKREQETDDGHLIDIKRS